MGKKQKCLHHSSLNFPKDLYPLIFRHLHPETLLELRVVSKTWNKIIIKIERWHDLVVCVRNAFWRYLPAMYPPLYTESWAKLPHHLQYVQYTFRKAEKIENIPASMSDEKSNVVAYARILNYHRSNVTRFDQYLPKYLTIIKGALDEYLRDEFNIDR